MSNELAPDFLRLFCIYHLGTINGNKKYHKLCYLMAEELVEKGYDIEDSFDFVRNYHGPTDEGISKDIVNWETLDIIEIEKEIKRLENRYNLTEKGKRFMNGLIEYQKRFGELLENSMFENVLTQCKEYLDANGHKSGSELEQDVAIKEAKRRNMLGAKLDLKDTLKK
ncbi:hypothetical protein [Methanococcus sp. CF]